MESHHDVTGALPATLTYLTCAMCLERRWCLYMDLSAASQRPCGRGHNAWLDEADALLLGEGSDLGM